MPTLVCRDCKQEKDTKKDYYRCEQPCKKCRMNIAQARRETPEGKLARRKEYLKNRKAKIEKTRQWALKNPEKRRAWRRAFAKTETGIRIAKDHMRNRRALKLNALVHGEPIVNEEWFKELKAQHNHRCYYCWESSVPLTMDHVIALNRGGKHIRSNMLPSCKPCNSRKSDKLISEWRPWIDIPLYGLELASA